MEKPKFKPGDYVIFKYLNDEPLKTQIVEVYYGCSAHNRTVNTRDENDNRWYYAFYHNTKGKVLDYIGVRERVIVSSEKQEGVFELLPYEYDFKVKKDLKRLWIS